MSSKEPIGAWTEWLEGDLWQQVHELFNQVHVYRSWNEIVGESTEDSKRSGFFHAWILHNYLDSIASGVRRLSDVDDRTNSLVRFLKDIEGGVENLSRDWWMSTAIRGEEEVCEKRFDELSNGGDHVKPQLIQQDRERVEEACKELKAYVDTHIAHLDAMRDRIEMPTIGDAHAAVRVIYQVYHQWFQVITGKALMPLQPPRWEHVLAVAWIDEDTAAKISDRRREEWEQEMTEMGIKN